MPLSCEVVRMTSPAVTFNNFEPDNNVLKIGHILDLSF